MSQSINRRGFLKGAATGVGFWVAQQYARGQEGTSPSDKLNVGIIGVAGMRGGEDLNELVATGLINMVALCDVDDNNLGPAARRFPKAKTYNDFRRMMDQKDVEAVLVATPDHIHAWATLAALRSGRHVYCEKPLTHSIEECRLVTETAKREKRVTQMGTQIHAGDNYRRVVELVQGGAIGPVNEVHVFCSTSTWWSDKPPRQDLPVPPNLHWDLWLGPVPSRPYSPDYLPAVWRKWWTFGEGILGDMACHYIDLPKWALKLGVPTRCRTDGPPPNALGAPQYVVAHWDFPARGDLPPVKLTWHDGGKRPEELLQQLNLTSWHSGVLFIGEKGQLIGDYERHHLLPQEKFKDFQPPEPSIPKSVGHHKEWVLACMKNDPAAPLCNFSYAGSLTETVLLGVVAFRTGEELAWNTQTLTAPNVPDAEQFIRLKYRPGWVL